MTTTPSPSPSDEQVRKVLTTANLWTRAALCTLARHGAALRRDDPARAGEVLGTLAPWPPYKGGQFLFDLMEWEDFMLDGDPPPLLPLEQALTTAGLPLKWLRAATGGPAGESGGSTPQELPELESSRYLYADVVLGAWETSRRLRQSVSVSPPGKAGTSRPAGR
ncbi:hypothetical protein [Streptomyces sp. NPDC057002]|uniref:hypothetical protein n=1 Tax=Streptomyces sp. NPDC057002 TaxID=3345992 RepID=UPI00363E6D88